jgi:ribosomal protein L27
MAKPNLKNIIRESITDYLTELNTEREEIQETPTLEEGASEFEDKVTKDGNIYLVLKADKNMAEGGIVREVSLKTLIDSYSKDAAGAYLAGSQALAAGKKLLKARDAKLKENIEVGKSKVAELEAKIEGLKKTIEDNSTRAVHDPQRRGELTETNDGLFAQLEKIENAVEKLKSVLDKESPKKAKKEDKKDEE